jgi:hypothetical protein
LRQEQIDVFGKPGQTDDNELDPLDFERVQTPLMLACIKEVLRLHPPIHSIMRKVLNSMPLSSHQSCQLMKGSLPSARSTTSNNRLNHRSPSHEPWLHIMKTRRTLFPRVTLC